MTSAQVRLFCLPYAGGSARMYAEWGRLLPDSVDVVPVEPPGRGTRFDETPHHLLEPLLDDLLPGLLARRDKPFALFGHSMGALVAFGLARRLEQRYGLVPRHLFASAFRAPHVRSDEVPDHTLPDEQFRARLREFNGTPEAVLADEGLMDVVIPILRADLAVSDTRLPLGGARLRCPVTAFAGTEDGEVGVGEVAQWARHTSGAFTIKAVPGDHFFLHSHRDVLLEEIVRQLCEEEPAAVARTRPSASAS